MTDSRAREIAKRNPGLGVDGAKGLLTQHADALAHLGLIECTYCLRPCPERPNRMICVACERRYAGASAR